MNDIFKGGKVKITDKDGKVIAEGDVTDIKLSKIDPKDLLGLPIIKTWVEEIDEELKKAFELIDIKTVSPEELDKFMIKPDSGIPIYRKCEHKWKHYQGLFESFDYCEICDEKKK